MSTPHKRIHHKRIHIVSDGGFAYGTRVYDEDGKDISNSITGIKWECNVDEIARATLRTVFASVDVVGEVVEVKRWDKTIRMFLWHLLDRLRSRA